MEHDFATAWRRFHPDQQPIGLLMRETETAHFVRFHSLPGSKRYADTDRERAILLYRANTLATAVLGEDGFCFLVQSKPVWEGPDKPIEGAEAYRACRAHALQYAMSFRDDEDDEVEWQAFAGLVQWRAGAFDDLIMDIADDVAAWTLWVSAADGAIVAPYDGGADLFLPTAEAVHMLKSKYADWLPRGLADL